MSEPERRLDEVAALLRHAGELDESAHRSAREAFLARARREPARPWKKTIVRLAIPLAVAAGFVAVILAWPAQQRLTYTVVGAAFEDGYVGAAPDRPTVIRFSDRTRIEALPGARLRINDPTGGNGARVSLEQGRLDVQVTPSQDASWRFEAGPFKLRVTGTRFALSWDAELEQIELVLREGSVDVQGYTGSGLVSVRAGQRLLGDAKKRMMLVTDIDAPRGPGGSLVAAPPTSVDVAPSALPTATAKMSGPGARPSWPALVSKGAFAQVVEEATARGIGACLSTCSAEELNALADAARYVGKSELAEQVLLALRGHHARSYGVRAAFLLGRLRESKADLSSAQTWYETALREGPGGAFASEALAGKMRAVRKLQGRNAARALAREYLSSYPQGVHAKAARQIADGS